MRPCRATMLLSLPPQSIPSSKPAAVPRPAPPQVCNESAIITRNFAELAAQGGVGSGVDLRPPELRADIDRWNERIYEAGGCPACGRRAGPTCPGCRLVCSRLVEARAAPQAACSADLCAEGPSKPGCAWLDSCVHSP